MSNENLESITYNKNSHLEVLKNLKKRKKTTSQGQRQVQNGGCRLVQINYVLMGSAQIAPLVKFEQISSCGSPYSWFP